MTIKLTPYVNGDIELHINETTGESFATIRGYARMAGKDESTIRERLNKRRGKTASEPAQVLTTTGLKTAGRLICEDTIAEWIFSDNPKLAKAMMKAGVRAYLHHLAGHKLGIASQPHKTEPISSQLPYLEHYPRLKHMQLNRDITNSLPNPCSINEFLEHYQVALTPGQFRALSCRVATTYRTLTMNDPLEKRCSINNSRCWCYEAEYQFLLHNALEVLLNGGVKRGCTLGRNKRSELTHVDETSLV